MFNCRRMAGRRWPKIATFIRTSRDVLVRRRSSVSFRPTSWAESDNRHLTCPLSRPSSSQRPRRRSSRPPSPRAYRRPISLIRAPCLWRVPARNANPSPSATSPNKMLITKKRLLCLILKRTFYSFNQRIKLINFWLSFHLRIIAKKEESAPAVLVSSLDNEVASSRTQFQVRPTRALVGGNLILTSTSTVTAFSFSSTIIKKTLKVVPDPIQGVAGVLTCVPSGFIIC